MPCKDTTSQMTVRLDEQERLSDFAFAKITCSKTVGGQTGYARFCRGRETADILQDSFEELILKLDLEKQEEQFFLFMEWQALRAALQMYLGQSPDEEERFELLSVDVSSEETKIQVNMKAPAHMPKIIACASARG